MDSTGAAYVTGSTQSGEASFPVTVGPDLTYNGGGNDAFVAKVNPSGTAFVYAGYIGGAGRDGGAGIAVDSTGAAYVTGSTESREDSFPVKGGPDLTHNGGVRTNDAFVAKVNPSGTALVYAGYIGGEFDEVGNGIAVDSAGNAYVTGQTHADEATFPVTGGPDLTYNGGDRDAFVAKVGLDTTVTYDTWSSRSFDFPPHEPIHDCVRLTESTISTDLCGDSGTLLKFPLLAVPGVDLWVGQLPCSGLNLVFVGTSLDGEPFPLGKKAIGASGIGLSQGTTLGLEGLENPNCSVPLSETNPYAAMAPASGQAVAEASGLAALGNSGAAALGPSGSAQTVANKTFEAWFSESFDAPPFLPAQDCWRFTATTMATDRCGDSGPLVEFPLFGVPGMSLWIGQVPCKGQNLVFFGTSYDGAIFPFGGNVVSGTAVGLTQGFTLAAEGFENPSCSIAP